MTEFADSPLSSRRRNRKGTCVEINSGGQVFFGLMTVPTPGPEEAVVFKFCSSRHVLQSEQMAAELASHLGIPAPASRLLLRAHDLAEWTTLAAAAEPLCPILTGLLQDMPAMLILQYVHGASLKDESETFDERLVEASTSLGRLFVLDLLLGNPDRLPSQSLQWRGNPSNVIWSGTGCVPIDAVVARRPPRLLVQECVGCFSKQSGVEMTVHHRTRPVILTTRKK